MDISIFKNIYQNDNGEIISIEQFINEIKLGKWKETIYSIQNEKNKEKRNDLKKQIPYVTISGTFSRRRKTDLIKHSGVICIDIDELDDIDKSFQQLKNDPFVFACFKSASGKGLAVLIKIDGRRHLDAYFGLEAYFVNKYQLYVDRSCKDITRARFVSYDPDLFFNPQSHKFANYIPKSETSSKRKLPNVVTGDNDMDYIISQITQANIDITDSSYFRWLEIGFAIASEYGEAGRQYFHQVSQFSSKYSPEKCDKQYTHCNRTDGEGISFATFLYHCKNAGISIISPETKHIVTVASMNKASGRGVGQAVKVLSEVDEISEEIAKPIVEKVYQREDIGSGNKLSKIESLEIFLNANYGFKRNEITRFIENKGIEIDSNILNTVYIRARKEVNDSIRFEEVDRLVSSEFTPEYNPVKEFLESRTHITETGLIKQLCESISSDTGSNQYIEKMITKWLVGIIASIYGDHSPLLLALTGGQGTGKTEFFRRLLPKELQEYYAESKLDAGKDDEILMCQKIMILDDEFGGKSKMESKRLKELTSKAYFTLREPYGRKNVRLRRIAVLCGTSNDESLLNDPTGNRRIIPIRIISMDHEKYNSIDKTALLIECYHLYKSGYNWNLDKSDILELEQNTEEFEQIRPEKELILRFLKPLDRDCETLN